MAKDYTVDIGHHLKSKKETKPKSKNKSKENTYNSKSKS